MNKYLKKKLSYKHPKDFIVFLFLETLIDKKKFISQEDLKRLFKKMDITENKMAKFLVSDLLYQKIPDVRDGLTPIQRRIIYCMYKSKFLYNRSFIHSSRVVGEVTEKYHPFGYIPVYISITRMVQDFSTRYPLIEGMGNFGIIGDYRCAAMNFTEIRLSQISQEIYKGIDKDIVIFRENFDGSLKEPICLPSKIPTLLINGAIYYTMWNIIEGTDFLEYTLKFYNDQHPINRSAQEMINENITNMPPHNITEVCNAIIEIINNPTTSIKELMTIILGPDFPTGGVLLDLSKIIEVYETGRGKLSIRGKIIEEITAKSKKDLVITEIPYLENSFDIIQSIRNLIKNGELKDVLDIKDKSDRKGLRIVLELTKDCIPSVVKNIIFNKTNLQTEFFVNNLVMIPIEDNNGNIKLESKLLNLKELINEYIKHRERVIYVYTLFKLNQVKEKLLNTKATSVLKKELSKLEKIIADKEKRYKIIKDELNYLIDNYGDSRRTQIKLMKWKIK